MQLSNLTLPLDPATAAPGANPSLSAFPAAAGSDQADDAFDGLLASAETIVGPGGATPQAVASAAIDPATNVATAGDILLPTPAPAKPGPGTAPDEATQEAIAGWLGFMATTTPPTPPPDIADGAAVEGNVSSATALGDSTAAGPEVVAAGDGAKSGSAGSSAVLGANSPSAVVAPAASRSGFSATANVPGDQTAAPATQDAKPQSAARTDGSRVPVRTRDNRAAARAAEETASPSSAKDGLAAQSTEVAGSMAESSQRPTSNGNLAGTPADQGTVLPFAPNARRGTTGSSRDTQASARVGQGTPIDVPADPAEVEEFSASEDAGTFVNQAMPVSDPRALTPLARPAVSAAAPRSDADESSEADLVESVAVELPSDAQPDSRSAKPGVRPSASNAATAVSQPAEAKFAAPVRSAKDIASNDGEHAEKNTVESKGERVTRRSEVFGINAAKPETLMPAPALSAQSPLPVVERSAAPVAPLQFNTFAPDPSSPEAEVAQAARRSVESAVEVSRHFATGDKRAVTLQFSVSGVDLGVRVELRGDAVHTTFRTDSPELRAALAQEWQSVAASQTGERSSRLADPVFTSAGSSSQAGTDSGAADQRGSQARQQQLFADAGNARALLRNKAPLLAPSAAPVATSLSRPGRLHTFA